mgnify:CR=1 FL=1
MQNILNNPNIRSYLGNQNITFDASGRPVVTQTLSPEERSEVRKTNAIQTGLLDILQKPAEYPRGDQRRSLGWRDRRRGGLRCWPSADEPRFLEGAWDAFCRRPRSYNRSKMQCTGRVLSTSTRNTNRWEESMRSRLANQGITMGNEASNTELENFRLGKQSVWRLDPV